MLPLIVLFDYTLQHSLMILNWHLTYQDHIQESVLNLLWLPYIYRFLHIQMLMCGFEDPNLQEL